MRLFKIFSNERYNIFKTIREYGFDVDNIELTYYLQDKLKKIDELNFSAVHILGGVTSGEDKVCVVDSYGKVKKYTDLYINDSSLINENLLKNPQGTIMFIAKRNIEKFLNENVN
jgi:choline dehydrogenase-like flavoprotein